MSTTPTATYTKLRSGDWGVRSTSPLQPGAPVVVRTKAGAEKTEHVERVVWHGNGVWLAAIARSHARGSYGSDDYAGWHRDSGGRRYQCERPGCDCGGYDDI